MSYIVKTHTLFDKSVPDGYVKVYLEFITQTINYETGKQSYRVNLIADVQGIEFCVLNGGASRMVICGREFPFNETVPLYRDYNLVTSIELNDIHTYSYGNTLPVRLIFNHTCTELGITDSIDVSDYATVNMLYEMPEVFPRRTDYTLGKNIELTGEFLTVGYDTRADITVNGVTVHSDVLDSSGIIPTSSEWMSSFPELVSATATLTIHAEFNGEPLPMDMVHTLNVRLVPEECVPEFDLVTFPSSDILAVADFGKLVRTKSRFFIAAENVSCLYGAYLKGCAIMLDGVKYSVDSYITPILTEAGVHTYSVTVTDSRGFEATKGGSFEVLDYAPPAFSATVTRVNESGAEDLSGEYLYIAYSMDNAFTFDGANSFEHYFTVKKSGGTESDPVALSEGQGAMYNASLENGNMYEVRIICTDTFGGVTERVHTVDCDRIELNIAKNKVAIGKIAETENLFDCAWPIKSAGDITFTDEDGNEISLRSLLKLITQ